MAQTNTAVKTVVVETLEEQLARLTAENVALHAQVAAIPAAGEFGLSVTVERKPGTRKKSDGTLDANDKGSKGGSLAIALGKQHVYPSKAMAMAIIEHADEIKAFIVANADKLTR